MRSNIFNRLATLLLLAGLSTDRVFANAAGSAAMAPRRLSSVQFTSQAVPGPVEFFDQPVAGVPERVKAIETIKKGGQQRMSDEELLAILIGREPDRMGAAFGDLRKTLMELCRVSRSRLQPDELEEIAQDILLKVWQIPPTRLMGIQDIRGYAARMFFHEVISHFRNDRSKAASSENSDALLSVSRGTSESAESRLIRLSALDELQKKSALNYQAFALRFFGGYKFRELKEILQVPLETAKSRYYAALDILRHWWPDHSTTKKRYKRKELAAA